MSEPELLERWFCEAELPPLAGHVDELDLERAKSLREAIFRLADNRLTGREIAPSDIALLNSHARVGMPSTRIACDGCSTEPPDAAEVNEMLGIISRDAIDVSPAHTGTEFANAPRRAVIFVDRSRAGNRRLCVMSPCGDQASARAYRQRKKTAL